MKNKSILPLFLTISALLFASFVGCKKENDDGRKTLTNLLAFQILTTPQTACSTSTLVSGTVDSSTPIELKYASSSLRRGLMTGHVLVSAVKGRFFVVDGSANGNYGKETNGFSPAMYKTSDCTKATNSNLFLVNSDTKTYYPTEKLPSPNQNFTVPASQVYLEFLSDTSGTFLLEMTSSQSSPPSGVKVSKATVGN